MTDIETIQAVYAAMAAEDIDALFELLDPEIVVTQDDRLPWGGRFEGHDGFATFGLGPDREHRLGRSPSTRSSKRTAT